jgi:proline iminopeptidase
VARSQTESVRLSDGAMLWTQSETRRGSAGVVLIHGGPGMWDYLGPVAGLLEGVVSTHRYDQRGCGRSSPDGNYRMARFVADLDELRTHFGYRSWFILGHSFGATLGLQYAGTYPDRVAGLVYCSGVGLDWEVHKATYHARADTRLTVSQRARRHQLQHLDRSWDEEVEWRSLCWLANFADPDRAEAMAREDAMTPLPLNLVCNRVLNAELKLRTWEDERATCRRVTAPVLVIHGSKDPRPLAGINALVNILPVVEFAIVEDAGHRPWREQSSAVQALLQGFVLSNGK